MPRSDGTVVIDTKIDMSGLNKGTVDIKTQFDKMANSARLTADAIGGAFSRPLENAKLRVESLERELDGIQEKLREAKMEDDDKAAARLGAQQERVYDRLQDARRKLEMEVRASAARQAEAEEKAAKKTEEANRKAAESARVINKETISGSKNMSGMEKSASRFKNRLREIVTGAFFFNIISSALSKLTRTMWDAISSTDQMQSAMSNLKNAASVAAAPLLNVLSRAFSTLANAIATALNYLIQLYSVLSGKSIGAIAQTAKEMNKVKTAAKGAGGAADKAKRSLAGFDEITMLGQKDSGGGGGVSGSDIQIDSTISPQIQLLAEKINALMEPLKKIDFSKAKKSLSGLGKSFKNLGKEISGALELAWFNILVPLSKWAIEDAAPSSVDLLAQTVDYLTSSLDPLIDGLGILLESMEPIFDFVGYSFIFILEQLGQLISKIGETFESEGESIRNIFSNVGDVIETVWHVVEPVLREMQASFKTVFEFIGKIASEKIRTVIGILEGLSEFTAGVFLGDWTRAWNGIGKVFTTVTENIINTSRSVTDFLGNSFLNACNVVKKAWENVSGWFNSNVVTPLKKVFSGLWDTITGIFSGEVQLSEVANKVAGYFKTLANAIIRGFNTALIRANSYVNQAIGKFKNFVIGGVKPFASIEYSTAPQIPYLAKGAVIPPNAPFMAMLGDQRHGTNIEAPLSTIQEAVALVMEDMIQSNLAGHEATIAVLREILQAILGIEIGDSVIGEAVERYNQTMAIVRGG